MIVDVHCHAWERWPYDRAVPDASSRSSVESLLYEMDANEVDRAVIVAACIGDGHGGDGWGNPDNNAYAAHAVATHPDRFAMFADADSVWTQTYHLAGAAERLERLLDSTSAAGFTHYFAEENDGWLAGEDARAWFEVAANRGATASFALSALWLRDLMVLAQEFPTVPILLHHLGRSTDDHEAEAVLRCASVPSIGVKLSGFNRRSVQSWRYPYADVQPRLHALIDAFGTDRLYWGSDFPASRDMLTYRQSIEVVRTEAADLLGEGMADVLGLNAVRLLGSSIRNASVPKKGNHD